MERALITGASAGIGVGFAERLAREGTDLVLLARRRDRLEELASRLHDEQGIDAEVCEADLANREGVARAEERAARGDITFLINNAGFGAYRPFVELDPEVAEQLISVHVTATTRLTRAVLPAMVERNEGTIVNVASLLAFSGSLPPERLPYRATYAACKAFMVTFTQTLAGELAGTKIRLQVCCPGIVATEFHPVQGMGRLPNSASVSSVVDGCFRDLEKGRVVGIPANDDDSPVHELSQAQLKVIFGGNTPVSPGARD